MSVHFEKYSRPVFVFDAELQAIVDKYDERVKHCFTTLLRTVYSGMYIRGSWLGTYSQEQVVRGKALRDYLELRSISVLIDVRKIVALGFVFDLRARDLRRPGVGPTTANKILALLAEVRQAFKQRPVATQVTGRKHDCVTLDYNIVHSRDFQKAIETRIECGDDFYTMLNSVCGIITSFRCFHELKGTGGGSLEKVRSEATPFEVAVLDAIEKFDGDPLDFRFTFMDTYVLIRGLREAESRLLNKKTVDD